MLSQAEIKEGRQQLTVLCVALGCSGLNVRCPGDPRCGILQKVARSQWAAETIAEAKKNGVIEKMKPGLDK